MYEQIVPSIYSIPTAEEIRRRQYIATKPQQLSDVHLHQEYEILIVNEGTLRCETNGHRLIAEAGDLVFINSYIPHSTYDETGGTHCSLLRFNSPIYSDASLKYILRFSRAIGSDAQILKGGLPDTESVKECAQSILDEINALKPFWREHVRAHIMLLLARLQRLGVICVLEPKDMNHVNKIKPVLDFINENYMNHISTAQMAEIVGLNETYFCRIFKNIVGTTPVDYLNFVRICKAVKMLRDTKISDIPDKIGFTYLSYFNRIFKKFKGCTPRQYKEFLKNNDYEPASFGERSDDFYNYA